VPVGGTAHPLPRDAQRVCAVTAAQLRAAVLLQLAQPGVLGAVFARGYGVILRI
jgi:hypothetical protein